MEHLANFSVSGNAKIFNLLTKHLYAQPLTAAIREAGTNAIDANRENNIDLSVYPIEITVLGGRADEPTLLKFTDRGMGIDPERMDRFVSQLGASSKRGDTNQNGTFGIGLLSILNISDQFAIQTTTIVNGELTGYHYIVFIGVEGIPVYTQIQVESTGQADTGSTISFPVKNALLSEVLATVVDVWNASDRVKIFRAIGGSHATVPHNSPEHTQKTTLFQQSGMSLVGNAPHLLDCLTAIVPVVKVGDVIYPVFCDRDRFHDLLSSRNDLQIGIEPSRNQLVRRLVPPTSLALFGSVWRHILGTDYEVLYGPRNANKLRDWHGHHRQSAILYLEFGKGEIELTVSREGLVANEANCLLVAERTIAAIAAITKEIEAQFLRLQADGDLRAAMNLASKIPGFNRIRFSEGLEFAIADLKPQISVMTNFDWTDVESAPEVAIVKKVSWLNIVWLLFKRAPTQAIRVSIVFGSSRKMSVAALERAIGAKVSTLGSFIAIGATDLAAAGKLIETYRLRELGHSVELFAAKSAPVKPRPQPLPASVDSQPHSQLLEIESIRSMATEIERIAAAGTHLNQIVQDFVPAVPGTIEGNRSRGLKSWYLPLTASTQRIEIAFYCLLAADLGIEGRLFFHLDGAAPDFHLTLPDAHNLLDEIALRAKAYISEIGDKCRRLGFIPGVDPNWAWYSSELHSSLFEPISSGFFDRLSALSCQLERLKMTTASEQAAIDFCFSSRRLNGLIFGYWHLIYQDPKDENSARLFGSEPLETAPTDDSRGRGVLKLLVGIAAVHFPLIKLCLGMPGSDPNWLASRQHCITESSISATLLLLTDSLPVLKK